MNPFIKISAKAGIFAASGPQGQKPNMAQRICKALSAKISQESSGALDPSVWQTTIGMIPDQVNDTIGAASAQISVSGQDFPQKLADMCLPAVKDATSVSALAEKFAKSLAKIPPLESLNCLSVSVLDPKFIRLSALMITAKDKTIDPTGSTQVPITVSQTYTAVDVSRPETAKDIEQLFGTFEPLGAQPYYVSVP